MYGKRWFRLIEPVRANARPEGPEAGKVLVLGAAAGAVIGLLAACALQVATGRSA
jgi:hypothetical protein